MRGDDVQHVNRFQRRIDSCLLVDDRSIHYRAVDIGGGWFEPDDEYTVGTNLPESWDDAIDGFWERVQLRDEWKARDNILVKEGIVRRDETLFGNST